MKYRSQCPRMIKSNGYDIFLWNIFKLYGEIIQPYNIGHTDLDVFVCKSFCHRYNNPGLTILHEMVIKIKGKITEA